MTLAIFDLDNTLIAGDSDYEWGRFLTDIGVVDEASYQATNRAFYEQYKAGTLDIHEFCRFAFKPLAEHDLKTLLEWRDRFLSERIEPLILPAAEELIRGHREAGHTLLIITATNLFITEPIAARLGVDDLLATEPEFRDGRYTGELRGVPCFQDGKVRRLEAWLENNAETMKGSWFYSDSQNDIPLLERVDNPVAVDPDEVLGDHAAARDWPIISLRES
ncbi:phosphoserine phosphatase [Thioalkalivibrio denitrificans]|uniref:Histidinol-phosphatase n=1 Tax=Thioalkalivibrio denitrificans TaxID=108003 RepID=A0A1V3NVM8_9GAMM|nr:HAD family hydrolase [Thioalkalivibrio denitrificans]OOG28776.1 phosphoserine phosphatase [Thioalkalivibrio denitrificans]